MSSSLFFSPVCTDYLQIKFIAVFWTLPNFSVDSRLKSSVKERKRVKRNFLHTLETVKSEKSFWEPSSAEKKCFIFKHHEIVTLHFSKIIKNENSLAEESQETDDVDDRDEMVDVDFSTLLFAELSGEREKRKKNYPKMWIESEKWRENFQRFIHSNVAEKFSCRSDSSDFLTDFHRCWAGRISQRRLFLLFHPTLK